MHVAKLWTVKGAASHGTKKLNARIVLHPEEWVIDALKRGEDASAAVKASIPIVLLPDPTALPDCPVVDAKGRRLYVCDECGAYESAEVSLCGYAEGSPYLRASDITTDYFRLIDECPHIEFLMPVGDCGKLRDAWTSHRPVAKCSIIGKVTHYYRPNVRLVNASPITTQAEADEQIPALLSLSDLCGGIDVRVRPTEPIGETTYLPGPNGRKHEWQWSQLSRVWLESDKGVAFGSVWYDIRPPEQNAKNGASATDSKSA